MRRTLRREEVEWFDVPASVFDILSDEPPPDQLTHAVYVFAFVGNELLLSKRKGEKGWSLPGGQRDPADPVEQTAKRIVSMATGCELGELRRFGWQHIRFTDKLPPDWEHGTDSYIRLYLAEVTGTSDLQAANRRFFPPIDARAEPAVQEVHLLFEEALLQMTRGKR
jgi:ADP-ribose pyrophosphatase YjhB (NUDIX family)